MSEQDTKNTPDGPQFALHKIYIKDLSFESPDPVSFFSDQSKQPEINLQLNTEAKKLDNNDFEVILSITVTAKPKPADEKTLYLAEIKQAGLFTLAGLSQQELAATINSFCPNILFPYAREAISNMIERGGFPQLLLAPINFDALYQQHIQNAATGTENIPAEAKH